MDVDAKNIEEVYVKLEQLEHVLKRPGLYIGSENPALVEQYVLDIPADQIQAFQEAQPGNALLPALELESGKPFPIIKRQVMTHMGLLKCLDEIVMNAEDHRRRMAKLITEGGKRGQENHYPVTRIECCFTSDGSGVEIRNTGDGIRLDYMPTLNMYAPELLFGNMLASSNFNDEKRGDIIGMNGMGAKLTNIFSKRFIVETVCHKNGLRYRQEWRNNMSEKDAPVITPIAKGEEPYTSITWYPDFDRFRIPDGRFTPELLLFCYRRIYDIAGLSNDQRSQTPLQVFLNGRKVIIPDFLNYVQLYMGGGGAFHAYDAASPGWQIVVSNSRQEEFEQVSFVNGSITTQGGTHVDYVTDVIRRYIKDTLKTKKIEVPVQAIKSQLWVFVHATSITKPEFSSQSKDHMIKHISEISREWPYASTKAFLNKLLAQDSPILAQILNIVKLKHMQELAKTDGTKSRQVDEENLDDAEYAGHPVHSSKCSLILTEGLSAKAMVMAGLSVLGREYYGVYPLKGKPANVSQGSGISGHPEIAGTSTQETRLVKLLKKIVGLKTGENYENYAAEGRQWPLRYGRILLLMDQDIDGFHITGLILNLVHKYWPSLLVLHRIGTIITPIVKVYKSERLLTQFYSLQTFAMWKEANAAIYEKARIKYFKGLGTSDASEAMSYFRDLHIIMYEYTRENDPTLPQMIQQQQDTEQLPQPPPPPPPQEEQLQQEDEGEQQNSADNDSELVEDAEAAAATPEIEGTMTMMQPERQQQQQQKRKRYVDEALELAFHPRMSNERKTWLRTYNPNQYADYDEFKTKAMPLSYFVMNVMKHYSSESVVRAIPHIADGLKPSQRKILYAIIARKLTHEMKVAQLAGYVAERTRYHSGEVCLMATMINMAQDFVGSNNINTLLPNGTFGSRIKGGKDASQGRYIHTMLNPITHTIYKQEDDGLCTYLEIDGALVEPMCLYPTVPMLLINGADGIGTAFMTRIPSHNPIECCSYIEALLSKTEQGTPLEQLTTNVFTEAQLPPLHMYALGFKGTFMRYRNRWYTKGLYRVVSEDEHTVVLSIYELPVGVWTSDYTEFLKSNVISQENKDNKSAFLLKCVSKSYERLVDFVVTLSADTYSAMHKTRSDGILELEHRLKLVSTFSMDNMYAFDEHNVIRRYESSEDLLLSWFKMRMPIYNARRARLIAEKQSEVSKLTAQCSFISEVTSDPPTILIGKVTKTQLAQQLHAKGYPIFRPSKSGGPADESASSSLAAGQQEEGEEDRATSRESDAISTGYDYILNMPLCHLTLDDATRLGKKAQKLREEAAYLLNSTVENIWRHDLAEFKAAFEVHKKTVLQKYELESSNIASNAASATSSKHQQRSSRKKAQPTTSLDSKRKRCVGRVIP